MVGFSAIDLFLLFGYLSRVENKEIKRSKQGDPSWPEFLWTGVCGEEINVCVCEKEGMCMCIYIYIYIYIERERERERTGTCIKLRWKSWLANEEILVFGWQKTLYAACKFCQRYSRTGSGIHS